MRKIWLVVAFAVAGVAGFAATAHALPCVAGCVYFYSDSTYTLQVGSKCWQCIGGATTTGTITQYDLEDNPFDSCCGGGGGNGVLCDYQNGVLYCY